MSPIISVIGIVVALGLFMFLSYKGYYTVVISLICAAIVAITGGVNPMTALTDAYMTKFAGFAKGYFLVFVLSAIFAKVMTDSGAAASIAVKVSRVASRAKSLTMQRFLAVLSISLVNACLTMGGVNVFAVTFIMVAIARNMFKSLDIPWHMYTCGFLGSATFTVAMMPGSPQAANLVPMTYFGTKPSAAPVLGIICSLAMVIMGCLYIFRQIKKAEKNGEGFFPTGNLISKEDLVDVSQVKELPMWKCLTPCIVLLIFMNGVGWSVNASLILASVVGYVIFFDQKINLKTVFQQGAQNGIMTVVVVCAVTGFGGVVATVPGFAYVVSALDSLPGPDAIQIWVAMNICAGMAGSCSGGTSIALAALSDKFLATGIPADTLHRLSVMSSIGIDTLPHNAGVISVCAVTKMTHGECYKHPLWISLVFPLIISFFAALAVGAGFYY